jgi:hypothetical protein
MTADEYVRGTHLQVGERLGEAAPEAAGWTTG